MATPRIRLRRRPEPEKSKPQPIKLSKEAEHAIDNVQNAAPLHVPTKASRRQVMEMSGLGFTDKDMGVVLGIGEPTVRDHYATEIELGRCEFNLKVGKRMTRRAMEAGKNGLIANMFVLKARAGWRDDHKTITNTGGANEQSDPNQPNEPVGQSLTDEERAIRLLQILNSATAPPD